MLSKLLDQYNLISKEIEREKKKDLNSALDSLVTSFLHLKQRKTPQNNEKERFREHEKNMLSLLCLRIAINGRLISNGYYEKKEQFQNDIQDAIQNVESLEYAWEISEAVLRDTLDLLLAVCSGCEDIIITFFQKKYKIMVKKDDEISADLYFLFNAVADYYSRNRRRKLAVSVMENLCCLSRERNYKELHQELVIKIMAKIGDDEPESTIQIGNSNRKYFEDSFSESAGNFYWFYGSALEKIGDTSEAIVFFKKCYAIRRAIYGENVWYTDIAKREYSLLTYASYGGMEERKFLCDFICNIENGVYKGIDKDLLLEIEAKTLYIMLVNWSDVEDIRRYENYLSLFEEICEIYDMTNDPLIKMRLAKNLRGIYYLKIGDYIQAETAFLDALDAKMPEGVVEIITEAQLKSNLLLIYYAQNDLEMAVPLLEELLDLIELEENSGLSEKDIYRIYGLVMAMMVQSMIEIDLEEVDDYKELVEEACWEVIDSSSDLQNYAKELGTFVSLAITLFMQTDNISKEDMEFYLQALCKMEQEKSVFLFDEGQEAWISYISAILAWNLNDIRTEQFVKRMLKLSEKELVPIATKTAILQTSAIYFSKKEENGMAMDCMKRALDELTIIWQSYVRYLNDERLMNVLASAQLLFGGCYALLRKHSDVEVLYERVLQFKMLASLTARERNRILHTTKFDMELLKSIQILQDRIAFLEAEHIFRDVSVEYTEDKAKLRKLEAEFAKKFPANTEFAHISWEKVKDAIPDNSAVIEFVYCSLDYGQLQFELKEEDFLGLDVYIIRKENGNAVLKKITIPNGEEILNQAETFISILQAESSNKATMKQLYEKDDIRADLFKKLIRPILSYIGGIETLYIAPDYELLNLPFEILYDEEQERLETLFNVIIIESARDFLFKKAGTSPVGGSLIIGNPQYELNERDFEKRSGTDFEQNRMLEMDFDSIKPLPFSQIEVQRVGKYCKSVYYTGYEASKNLLSSLNGYRNIHIATHGYFDLSKQSMPMYASCLLFAGVRNWAKESYISSRFGNGMMTADEVSRLDMTSVELVVLSSCLSGMNEVSLNKGFRGMIGALSAAGAKYVVSHLWAADDFATAILMDAFYYQYVEKKQSPPAALNFAKNYLKNVSIGELKHRQWFTYMKKSTVDTEAIKIIEKYENYNDRVRPFKGEAYWGGFVCYQCN